MISRLAPPAFCLILYWYGLKAWFQTDDFSWLGLSSEVRNWDDLWRFLFTPMAGGSVRTLSERAFFLGFYSLFGLNALPFRIWVFLTQFANLALLGSIAKRLTGSRAAGFWAPMLWTANSTLAVILSWTAVYNQVLCIFFILAAFYSLLRHIETGERRCNRWQWVWFLLGFGALEVNVVYPALAAAYTFLCQRRYFRRTLWLFVPAVVFVAAQRAVAPKASGLYRLYFDASMADTLWTYWQWALGPSRLDMVGQFPAWVPAAGTAILSAALLGYAIGKAIRREWLPLFLLAWFAIAIAPVLPLREHLGEYYPALPSIGLAILGAMGLVQAWRQRLVWKIIAGVALLAYLPASLAIARRSSLWMYDASREVERLVRGVERAHELHPGKTILLAGVSENQFWRGIRWDPFRLIGAQVYLAPGAEGNIQPHPGHGNVWEFVLSREMTRERLQKNQIVVYAAGGERLRNITETYKASFGVY